MEKKNDPYTSSTITTLGTNNLYGDPRFASPAWGTNGDYRLQISSPAINGGSSLGAPAVDLNSYARTSPVDIGAYEYGSQPNPGPGPGSSAITRPATYSKGIPWVLLLIDNH